MARFSQPQFDLLFRGAASAPEINLRLRGQQQAQQRINQEQQRINQAQPLIDERIRASESGRQLDQIQFLKGATELKREPERFELERAERGAGIDRTRAATEQSKTTNLLTKLGFAGNKYARVKDQKDLTRVNRLLQKQGVLDRNQIPATVAEAQIFALGSKLHVLQEAHNQQLQELQLRGLNEAQKQRIQLKMQIKLMREKEKLVRETAKFNRDSEHANEIQKLLLRDKLDRNAGRSRQPTININNQLPGTAEVDGAVVPALADGGPVNRGGAFVVGEEGPELFVPNQDGAVLNQQQVAAVMQNNPAALVSDGQQDEFGSVPQAPGLNPQQQNALRMADDLLGQPDVQAEGPEQDPNRIEMSKTTRARLEQSLLEAQEDLAVSDQIADNFNSELFTYSNKIKLEVGKVMDKLGFSDQETKDFIQKASGQQRRIMQQALIYRKNITGVAGGEREMKEIIKNILNPGMGPAEAREALADMRLKTLRAVQAKQEALLKGLDVGSQQYSNAFLSSFRNVEIEQNDTIEDLIHYERTRNNNPSFDKLDAVNALFGRARSALQPRNQ